MKPQSIGAQFLFLIEGYLERQHALGRAYGKEERVLLSLYRFLKITKSNDISPSGFEKWCESFQTLNPNTRLSRLRIVRKFCLYRQRTEPSCFVPDAYRFPRKIPHVSPVIFGEAEVSRMLHLARELVPTSRSPLFPAVMRIAIVLLYTAGLRRGELLRLNLADVNLKEGILRIRKSKFHKSRFVPLSRSANQELRKYLKKRCEPPFDADQNAPLLRNRTKGYFGYTGTGLSRGIKALFVAANVQSDDGRRPRIHDFRHSFAVQSLLRLYQQHADVQSGLPKLSMYMGHVSIVSTAYYLRLIPEIAQAASNRFETRFGHLIKDGAL